MVRCYLSEEIHICCIMVCITGYPSFSLQDVAHKGGAKDKGKSPVVSTATSGL